MHDLGRGPLDLFGDFRVLEPEVQIGGHEAFFRTAIKAAAGKAHPMDRHLAEVVGEAAADDRNLAQTLHGLVDLPARFKPKPISEEEMLAIETGGADFTF